MSQSVKNIFIRYDTYENICQDGLNSHPLVIGNYGIGQAPCKKQIFIRDRLHVNVKVILLAMEFEPVQIIMPETATCIFAAAREHVGDIEHEIHVIKERGRSTITNTPFKKCPHRVIIETCVLHGPLKECYSHVGDWYFSNLFPM